MRIILTFLLVIFVQLSFAQRDSIVAEKITKRVVRGKYVYLTSHGRIFLKVRPAKYFKWHGINSFFWTISRGKWKIQNDTLILIEKFNREEPFGKRNKVDTDTIQFIMNDGDLFRVNNTNGKKVVKEQYISKKAWKKYRRSRNQRRIPRFW